MLNPFSTFDAPIGKYSILICITLLNIFNILIIYCFICLFFYILVAPSFDITIRTLAKRILIV
jgi:hypothetical protein